MSDNTGRSPVGLVPGCALRSRRYRRSRTTVASPGWARTGRGRRLVGPITAFKRRILPSRLVVRSIGQRRAAIEAIGASTPCRSRSPAGRSAVTSGTVGRPLETVLMGRAPPVALSLFRQLVADGSRAGTGGQAEMGRPRPSRERRWLRRQFRPWGLARASTPLAVRSVTERRRHQVPLGRTRTVGRNPLRPGRVLSRSHRSQLHS